MKRTLLACTALLALAVAAPAHAATFNLGVNPTSATGDFSNDVGGGLFNDFYTFQLVGSPSYVTITSATNVYAQPSDFITNFTGAVYETVGVPGGGDDILQFGPELATACLQQASCQILAGAGILDAGNYYLQIAGIGGGTSGYGGNLAVAPVPIPGALVLFASGLVGLGLLGKKKLQKKTDAVA